MTPSITFNFYAGQGFLGELVRDLSACPGERTSDTPGHVSVVIQSTLYQATWPRVQRVNLGHPDYNYDPNPKRLKSITVPLTAFKMENATAWLEEQVGKPYSVWAIIKDCAARLFPGAVAKWSRAFYMQESSWTCSTLAYTAARLAGIGLTEPDFPIDPNSLMRLLEEYLAATTPRFADQRPQRDAKGHFLPGNPYINAPRGADGKFIRGRVNE